MANTGIMHSVFIISSFFFGFVAGYYSLISNLLSRILEVFVRLKLVTSQLFDFAPRPNFLSDVAAFEAVAISIAIPLSFEIISRISERYQSDVITKRFSQERVVRWLPGFLIANIIVAITLRFILEDAPITSFWRVLAWLTLIGFLLVATALIRFFLLLKDYMAEPEFILSRLFDEAEKSLKS